MAGAAVGAEIDLDTFQELLNQLPDSKLINGPMSTKLT